MADWIRANAPWAEQSALRPDRDDHYEQVMPKHGGEGYVIARRCRCPKPLLELKRWPRCRPFYTCVLCGHDVRGIDAKVFAGAAPVARLKQWAGDVYGRGLVL